MPSIQGKQTNAAGITTNNVLAGSLYELAPFDAFVEIGLVETGALSNGRVTVNTGPQLILEESAVSIANRYPIYPDDYSLSDTVRQGDRIVIRYRNGDAAQQSLFWSVRLTPL
jgi:hypothetical protein